VGAYVGLSISGIMPIGLNLFTKKDMEFAETMLKVEDVKAVAKLFS